MDTEPDPMDPARAAASTRIGRNALTLDRLAGQTRQDPSSRSAARRAEVADLVSDGVITAANSSLNSAAKALDVKPTTGAERAAAQVGRGAVRAPGLAYDLGQIALAKDKARAVAGVLGGRIGTGVGEALIPEGVVVGPVAGAILGEQAGKAGFDLARDQLPRLTAAIRRLPDRAETAFRWGMPPNSATLR